MSESRTEYVVTANCYIPVNGTLKYKSAGQVVLLTSKDAASMEGFVKPNDGAPVTTVAPTAPELTVTEQKKAKAKTEPEVKTAAPRTERVQTADSAEFSKET